MTHACDFDCFYTCLACSEPACRETQVSPREVENICLACYETEDPDDAA
jgi:hypothetical protein